MEDEASYGSSPPRPSLEERRASVFARLAQRQKSRAEQSLARRFDSGDAAPIFENPQAFLRSFYDADRCIRSKIETIRSVSNPTDAPDLLKAELEAIAVQITDLEKQVAENSYFLASYDVRSSQKVIAELKEQLGGANTAILPRKKFSFGFKPVKTEKNPVLMENGGYNGASLKNGGDVSVSVEEGSSFSVRETPGFRNQEGVLLVKDFEDTRDSDFAISDLGSCEVYLKGCSRAVFVHRLRDCRVHIGPVIGSILIEDVGDCIFIVVQSSVVSAKLVVQSSVVSLSTQQADVYKYTTTLSPSLSLISCMRTLLRYVQCSCNQFILAIRDSLINFVSQATCFQLIFRQL